MVKKLALSKRNRTAVFSVLDAKEGRAHCPCHTIWERL